MNDQTDNTGMTVADLVKQPDPGTDREAIEAALTELAKDSGSLVHTLTGIFFHTLQRLDRHEFDGTNPYTAMPLNQIVALADWYVDNLFDDEQDVTPADTPEDDPFGGADLVQFGDAVRAQRDLEKLIDDHHEAGGLTVLTDGEPTPASVERIQTLVDAHPNAAHMKTLMIATGILDAIETHPVYPLLTDNQERDS